MAGSAMGAFSDSVIFDWLCQWNTDEMAIKIAAENVCVHLMLMFPCFPSFAFLVVSCAIEWIGSFLDHLARSRRLMDRLVPSLAGRLQVSLGAFPLPW